MGALEHRSFIGDQCRYGLKNVFVSALIVRAVAARESSTLCDLEALRGGLDSILW